MSLIKKVYVDGETKITAENLNAIQDAIIDIENGSGGGGGINFYPEVIALDGYDSVEQGQQVNANKIIDVGMYAILQPYYTRKSTYSAYVGSAYEKRALGKCISQSQNIEEIPIKDTRSNRTSQLGNVGDGGQFYGVTIEYNIGDYIATQVIHYDGTELGWEVSKITSDSLNYIIEYSFPSGSVDYNGEGVLVIENNLSTFEIITVIDMYAPPKQVYLHNITLKQQLGPGATTCISFPVYSTKGVAFNDTQEFIDWVGNTTDIIQNNVYFDVDGGTIVDNEFVQFGRIECSREFIMGISKYKLGTSGGQASVMREQLISFNVTDLTLSDNVIPIFA